MKPVQIIRHFHTYLSYTLRWLLAIPTWIFLWIISLFVITFLGNIFFTLDSLISFGPDGIDIGANNWRYQCWKDGLVMFLSTAAATWVAIKIPPIRRRIALYVFRSLLFVFAIAFVSFTITHIDSIDIPKIIAHSIGFCLGVFLVPIQKTLKSN